MHIETVKIITDFVVVFERLGQRHIGPFSVMEMQRAKEQECEDFKILSWVLPDIYFGFLTLRPEINLRAVYPFAYLGSIQEAMGILVSACRYHANEIAISLPDATRILQEMADDGEEIADFLRTLIRASGHII